MKLELKHLAPYLPYNLKVSKTHTLHTGEGIGSVQHILTTQCYKYKPILRPMSDLNKEIDHNIVPVHELFKVNREYLKIQDKGVNHLGKSLTIWRGEPSNIICRVLDENIMNSSFISIQKLFEWHFDVFGLIEKGLAIDINKL